MKTKNLLAAALIFIFAGISNIYAQIEDEKDTTEVKDEQIYDNKSQDNNIYEGDVKVEKTEEEIKKEEDAKIKENENAVEDKKETYDLTE